MKKKFFNIFDILDNKEKKNFFLVSFYKFLEAFFEVVSIGAIYPLLYMIFSDDLKLFKNQSIIKIDGKDDLFFFVLITLMIIFLIKAIFFAFASYKSNYFLVNLTKSIQIKLLNKYLNQDYLFFLRKKKDKLLNDIITESVHFSKSQIQPLYVLLNESIKLILIFLLIFLLNPLFTILSLVFFLPIIIFFIKKLKIKLKILGELRQANSEKMIEFANKGLNSIREILIFKIEKLFSKKFNQYCKNLNETSLQNNLWQEIPKIVLEFLVVFYILGVFTLTLMLSFSTIEESFVFLSFLSISFVRLLPSTNRIIKSVQDLSFYSNVTKIIRKSFKLKKKIINSNEKNEKINLKSLEFKNVEFLYNKQKIFENISFNIKNNLIYGVTGASGSGKTTLFNLLIGFLNPTKGKILINGEDLNILKNKWQNSLCYIPQDLYLWEDTIEKNITLSEEKSDSNRLKQSVFDSKLSSLIQSKADKFKYIIKNAGVNLSGGQRQRIGIARSLYLNRDIIFFDETTNALDKDTEASILKELRTTLKNKTIFIISHNKNLNKYVDKLITIKDQNIKIKNARY